MENVAKIVDWTKKSYIWKFEFKNLITGKEEWHALKIQFLDSLNSGKRTIIVNDQIVLNKARLNNFAIEPY